MMGKFRTSLYFDMRAPEFGAPAPELYAAALDMAEFADRIGMDHVGVMEHHGSEDGYLPTPFVMGAAVAARTKRIRISLGAVVLPLHDPLKVAEDITILDQISNGRLEVILGAGYVPYEFDRFRVSLHDRAKLMDKGIEIILRALRGERFEDDGREIFVRPLPVQDPRDILLVGGGVKASALRAARFDLGFAPVTPKLFALYEEQMRERGQQPRRLHGPGRPLSIHLARGRGFRRSAAWTMKKRCARPVFSRCGRRINCLPMPPLCRREPRWVSCRCWAGSRRSGAGKASICSKRSCQSCGPCRKKNDKGVTNER
jgi:hypothetical protein